jgi:alpha-ketoglutarate-dependent 2,4-dichlorophenoxyacetate dioxygenase
MTWQIRPLTPHFGLELSGQKLTPDLPLAEKRAVYEALVEHGVVAVAGQSLSDADYHAFGESIGEVVPLPPIKDVDPTPVALMGNIDRSGNFFPEDSVAMRAYRATHTWHVDYTYVRPRMTVSMLYALVVPPAGGNTEFCDLRLAWEALPAEEQARLDGLIASHWLIHTMTKGGATFTEAERAQFPPIARPLVQVHPESGRKVLAINHHIASISGMEDAEAQSLVAELTQWAASPERVYSHRWSPGDLLLWDNRSVMHRATPFAIHEHKRDVRGLRLKDHADV